VITIAVFKKDTRELKREWRGNVIPERKEPEHYNDKEKERR